MLHLFLFEFLIQIKSAQTSEVGNDLSFEDQNKYVILSVDFKEDSIRVPQKQDAMTSKAPNTVENNKLVVVENECKAESYYSNKNDAGAYPSDKCKSKKRRAVSESENTIRDVQNKECSLAKKIRSSENFATIMEHIATAKSTIGYLRECLIEYEKSAQKTVKSEHEKTFLNSVHLQVKTLMECEKYLFMLQKESGRLLGICAEEKDKSSIQSRVAYEAESTD